MTRTITRNRFRRTAGAIAVGALALAAAAGCSSSSTSTAASTSAAKVTLVVYSAQGYDQAMTTAFHKATGIPVKLDDNSTGPLLTQIEASKNNPNWGLLWVDGATAFAGLDQQGLLQKGFEPKVDWNSLGQQSLPADKSYTPTGVTLMAALVYNKTKVTDPPATWQQLLAAAVEGRRRDERPVAVRADLPVHRRDDELPGRREQRRELLHQAQVQRADHPPDQRAHAAGADQRPDQAGARAELGGHRRGARRQAAGRQVPRPGDAAAERDRHRRQGARRRAGRGGEVHRLRALAGRPEGDADR